MYLCPGAGETANAIDYNPSNTRSRTPGLQPEAVFRSASLSPLFVFQPVRDQRNLFVIQERWGMPASGDLDQLSPWAASGHLIRRAGRQEVGVLTPENEHGTGDGAPGAAGAHVEGAAQPKGLGDARIIMQAISAVRAGNYAVR